MDKDVKEILLTAEQIQQRVAELGAQITADYEGKTILLCGILKGAVTLFYGSIPSYPGTRRI